MLKFFIDESSRADVAASVARWTSSGDPMNLRATDGGIAAVAVFFFRRRATSSTLPAPSTGATFVVAREWTLEGTRRRKKRQIFRSTVAAAAPARPWTRARRDAQMTAERDWFCTSDGSPRRRASPPTNRHWGTRRADPPPCRTVSSSKVPSELCLVGWRTYIQHRSCTCDPVRYGACPGGVTGLVSTVSR